MNLEGLILNLGWFFFTGHLSVLPETAWAMRRRGQQENHASEQISFLVVIFCYTYGHGVAGVKNGF